MDTKLQSEMRAHRDLLVTAYKQIASLKGEDVERQRRLLRNQIDTIDTLWAMDSSHSMWPGCCMVCSHPDDCEARRLQSMGDDSTEAYRL